MFLTQPPMSAVAIKHPVMPMAWMMLVASGVRIWHVLQVRLRRAVREFFPASSPLTRSLSQTIRKTLGPLPQEVCESYLREAGIELRLLIGFEDANGNVARKRAGPLYRPLKAKLKIRLEDLGA